MDNLGKTQQLIPYKQKDDEYILMEIEDNDFDKLPQPISLVKDVPQPNINERNEEKARKIYRNQINQSTFLLTCGENALNPNLLDEQNSLKDNPNQYKSRRYKEDEKYAIITVEEGSDPTICILDEKWIFSRKKEKAKNIQTVYETPVFQEEKKKKKRRGDNSEDESYSHQDDKYQDDDDDFNKKHRKSQDYTSSDSSSSEDDDRRNSKEKLKRNEAKKQRTLTRDEIKEKMIEILKKNGNEMYLEEFKTAMAASCDVNILSQEIGMIMYDIIVIEGNDDELKRVSLKKDIAHKKRKTHKKTSTKKTTQKKEAK